MDAQQQKLASYAETAFDFAEANFEQFQEWLEEQMDHRRNDPVFQKRCEIRDLKRQKHFWLKKNQQLYQEALAKYEQAPNKELIDQLEREITNRRKAIEGLKRAVREREGEAKQQAREKLLSFCEQQKQAREKYWQVIRTTPERREMLKAKSRLNRYRRRIGLAQKEQELEQLNQRQGQRSSQRGSGFEKKVCQLLEQQLAEIYSPPEPTFLIPGLTLGCARAEIDYLFISPGKERAEVLALIEVKRNPNDVGKSFQIRQENLAWFTQDTQMYDPELYRTKVFKKGHFDQTVTIQHQGQTFCFDSGSFQNFSRAKSNNFFLDRLFFVSCQRPLKGLNSGDYNKLLYRVATDLEFDWENEEYLRSLFAWCQQMRSSLETSDVLKIYAQKPQWARQFLFAEK